MKQKTFFKMKSVAIVTMSDSNFFELLTELIDSINNFNQRKDVAVCVLDAGLSEDQIKFLSQKAKVDLIKKANWDIEVPSYKVRGKEWLKSQVSRAFLPDYFPGFKKYLWIDADAWVNSWEAIQLYLKGSDNNKLAIATSADRSYGRVLRVSWLFGGFAQVKSQNYKHAKTSGFSEDIARKVALKPHLNIGVFCLNHSAPHWLVWQKNLEKALFGMGCFWGVEKKFWELEGVYSTAVGYSGGETPNPSYKEVCSGMTGHNETVLVIYDPKIISFDKLLTTFWE